MTYDCRKIRISEPNELLDAVPYLLGFHPRNSLCVLGFSGNPEATSRRVELAARIDLPAKPVAEAAGRHVMGALARSGSHSAIGLIYPDETGDRLQVRHRWWWLHNLLTATSEAFDIALLDVLVVSADHWWSLCCADASCCPDEGHARVVGESAAAAEAVFAGLVAAKDRSELEACLNGDSAERRARLDPVIAEAESRLVQARTSNGYRRLIGRDTAAVMRAAAIPAGDATARPGRLTTRQLARHAVALGEHTVRDALWLAVDERSVDASHYLLQFIRRLPRPYDAAALFLYGWQQWRAGNGTLACIAGERALASDSQYSAAELLIAAVQHGLNPVSTPLLRGSRTG